MVPLGSILRLLLEIRNANHYIRNHKKNKNKATTFTNPAKSHTFQHSAPPGRSLILLNLISAMLYVLLSLLSILEILTYLCFVATAFIKNVLYIKEQSLTPGRQMADSPTDVSDV